PRRHPPARRPPPQEGLQGAACRSARRARGRHGRHCRARLAGQRARARERAHPCRRPRARPGHPSRRPRPGRGGRRGRGPPGRRQPGGGRTRTHRERPAPHRRQQAAGGARAAHLAIAAGPTAEEVRAGVAKRGHPWPRFEAIRAGAAACSTLQLVPRHGLGRNAGPGTVCAHVRARNCISNGASGRRGTRAPRAPRREGTGSTEGREMLSLFFGGGRQRAEQTVTLATELEELERQAREASPGYDAQLYNRAAELCLNAGDRVSALKYLGRAIDAYLDTGRFNAAAVLCQKVLRISPEAVRARSTLTWLALGQEDVEGAERALADYVAA